MPDGHNGCIFTIAADVLQVWNALGVSAAGRGQFGSLSGVRVSMLPVIRRFSLRL